MSSLLRLRNVTTASDLPPIWDAIYPLYLDRERLDMETTCHTTADQLRFQSSQISHAVKLLLLCLYFYFNYLEDAGNAIKTFLFPDLSPSVRSKADPLACWWDEILGGRVLTSFVDTSLLLANKNLDPITISEVTE